MLKTGWHRCDHHQCGDVEIPRLRDALVGFRTKTRGVDRRSHVNRKPAIRVCPAAELFLLKKPLRKKENFIAPSPVLMVMLGLANVALVVNAAD